MADKFPRHYTMWQRRALRFMAAGGALLAAAALLRMPIPAWAGQTVRVEDQGSIRVQVNLVNLFATVRDKKTRQIVSGLSQDDFQITEDGKPQKIVSFSKDSKLPITLGLLLDTSGSEQYTLGAEQDAAISFFSRVIRKGDLSMVMSFDTDADLLADFTSDVNILSRAVRRARINAPSREGPLAQLPAGTVLYDAIYLACHEKLATEAGRKAIVILTDAEDMGSKLRVQDAIEAAQRSDTVVHILLVGDPQHFSVNEGMAKKITDETGGRTIVVRNPKDLQEAFDKISEEFHSQYSLGYYSSNEAHDGSYRKIKVETPGKNREVLTRRGYYAPTE